MIIVENPSKLIGRSMRKMTASAFINDVDTRVNLMFHKYVPQCGSVDAVCMISSNIARLGLFHVRTQGRSVSGR